MTAKLSIVSNRHFGIILFNILVVLSCITQGRDFIISGVVTSLAYFFRVNILNIFKIINDLVGMNTKVPQSKSHYYKFQSYSLQVAT